MHVYRFAQITLRRDTYVYVHVCYGLEMNLYNLVEKFTTYRRVQGGHYAFLAFLCGVLIYTSNRMKILSTYFMHRSNL